MSKEVQILTLEELNKYYVELRDDKEKLKQVDNYALITVIIGITSSLIKLWKLQK